MGEGNIFTLCVSSHLDGGGGVPDHRSGQGYPFPGLDGGYPITGQGVPCPRSGGVPHPRSGRGGVPHPRSGGALGYSLAKFGWWGVPQVPPWPGLDGGGVPGVPPPPSQVWMVGGPRVPPTPLDRAA